MLHYKYFYSNEWTNGHFWTITKKPGLHNLQNILGEDVSVIQVSQQAGHVCVL